MMYIVLYKNIYTYIHVCLLCVCVCVILLLVSRTCDLNLPELSQTYYKLIPVRYINITPTYLYSLFSFCDTHTYHIYSILYLCMLKIW